MHVSNTYEDSLVLTVDKALSEWEPSSTKKLWEAKEELYDSRQALIANLGEALKEAGNDANKIKAGSVCFVCYSHLLFIPIMGLRRITITCSKRKDGLLVIYKFTPIFTTEKGMDTSRPPHSSNLLSAYTHKTRLNCTLCVYFRGPTKNLKKSNLISHFNPK